MEVTSRAQQEAEIRAKVEATRKIVHNLHKRTSVSISGGAC